MASDDDDTDARDERIERLKARAATASGGRMMSYEADGLSPALREQFWQRVIDAETAPTTTLVKELSAIGVDLPDPDGLDDEALHTALWTIIEALGTLHVYLDQTDHLSDRELYTTLLRDILPEEMDALDVDDSSAWHIDILGGCSLEDVALFLKYYADDEAREFWRRDVPDFAMPEHVDPPYDRDSRLPQARWSR
jgi:hypothetical protein